MLFKRKRYESALKRYDEMKSTELVKKGLGELVMYHRAMTLMEMKRYDQAKPVFVEFSKDTDCPYRREAHAGIARIYEAEGKNKEAVQAYRQYLKMFPKAPDAALVKTRIANLTTQG